MDENDKRSQFDQWLAQYFDQLFQSMGEEMPQDLFTPIELEYSVFLGAIRESRGLD